MSGLAGRTQVIEDRELGARFVLRVWCESSEMSDEAIRGSLHCVDGGTAICFVGLAQLLRQLPQTVRGRLLREEPKETGKETGS